MIKSKGRALAPLFLFFLVWVGFIWPLWLKNLVPAPLDFLVGFFAPWRDDFSIPIKNPAIADVVNQIIPWKLFTAEELRQGRLPLWNPYNFAGTIHAANWQSAVFYPLNILFLVLNFLPAWSLYVLAQPLLAGFFTYLYARILKLSSVSALLAAVGFAFGGFMTSWLEWGTLGHALLWLPLSLWAIERYLETKKPKFLLLNALSLSLSLLAGHLQVSLYVITTSFAYLLYRLHQHKTLTIRKTLFSFILYAFSFLIVAFQALPSIEAYLASPRSQDPSSGWFRSFLIPPEQLATFVAPDFFGNPTTRNQWGRGSYVEMMGYVGLVPLFFAFTALAIHFKKRQRQFPIAFFASVILIAVLLSVKNPLAQIPLALRLPVFSSSSPARIIGLVSFALAMLAGIGFEVSFPRSPKDWFKRLVPATVGIVGILVVLWLSTVPLLKLVPLDAVSVARRNLVLPTVIFLILITAIYSYRFAIKLTKIKPGVLRLAMSSILLAITIADLYRFHHKFTPYTPATYFYPDFSLKENIATLDGADRVFGLFDANLNLPLRTFSTEGYDALVSRRYVELVSAHKTGAIAVADRISGVEIGKNDPYTIAMLNLLSVRYVVQPTVHGSAPWELHLWEYPDQFELIIDNGQYQLFENIKATPRFFLTSRYLIETDAQRIIDTLLNVLAPGEIVLEENPGLTEVPGAEDGGVAKVNRYTPRTVELSVASKNQSILFMSDAFAPGWKATVDGEPSRILRANYVFRGVVVPAGDHQVVFRYRPDAFILGLLVAGGTLLALIASTRKEIL